MTLSAWGAGATLLSFVAALVHFTIEVLVYKTMSLKSAANPLVIAGALPAFSAPHMQSACMAPLAWTSVNFRLLVLRCVLPNVWLCVNLPVHSWAG